jgi:hypothetical protein
MAQSRREARFELIDDCDAWTYYEPGKGPLRPRSPSAFRLSRWWLALALGIVTLAWLAGLVGGWSLCLLLR